MENLSMSSEDYLEAIVVLGGTLTHPVRNVDISAELGVTKASVSKAITSLREEGMVLQEPYGGVRLTPDGACPWRGRAVPTSCAGGVSDSEAGHQSGCRRERGLRDRTFHIRCVL